MQLKNNLTRNAQFYFWKESKDKDGKKKPATLEYVHIPGGATVELEDSIFNALTASLTDVKVLKEVETLLDDSNIGADIKSGKEVLTIKEYFETGETRTVNLLKEAIKNGEFTIVERVKVGMPAVDELLAKHGIPGIKDMPEDAKLALYDKLV